MTTTTKTSRYGDPRKTTNHGDGWYTIEGIARYYRVGMNEENTEIDYFDPEGGPFIHVGDLIDNRKIVSIIVEKVTIDPAIEAPKGVLGPNDSVEKYQRSPFKIRLETEELDPNEANANNKQFRKSNMK